MATLVRGEPDAKKNAPAKRRVADSIRDEPLTVGASLLAKVVNDDTDNLTPSGALSFFASKLAPTVNSTSTRQWPPAQVGEAGAASVFAHSSGV
ncbi:hypothetical protein BZ164_02995 [Pseudomonas veronii]|nr:hypothetical protein BZ164_02995 [Pseudomonas veronii]